MITLLVIGVVAALTIPALMKDTDQKGYEQSKNVSLLRLQEATNQMKTNDELSGFATSTAFANEFSKYIKVARRCTSANITTCFVPKFKLVDNTEIDTTTLTTGVALGHSTYTSNNVGIGLANGTNMILAFDPACARIDTYNSTIDTTSCLAVIYDINGAGKPNQVGKDIALLNVALSTCSGITINGLCVSASATTFAPINEAPFADNYWAGARNACIAQGMKLPTMAELSIMIQNEATIGSNGGWYWAATEASSDNAQAMTFNEGGDSGDFPKNEGSLAARCVK